MRAASLTSSAQAPTRSLPLKPVKPIKRDEKSEAEASSHRRKIQVVKSEPAPAPQTPPERTQPTPQMKAPTPEEVEADPLVKSVLDVFEGEIKRVHPKNK
jgi:hypothetical protein